MGLLLSQCRGQCYDGASNMAGCKNGVATQIQAKEKKAILTHCYGHALNLAVSDCIKQSKLCQDAMDSAFEISTYGEMNGHESCGLYIFGFHSAVRSVENVWRFYKLDCYLIK